jgi:hypothetical protein
MAHTRNAWTLTHSNGFLAGAAGRYAVRMSNGPSKPFGPGAPPAFGEDDFGELDAFGPSTGGADGQATRVATAEQVSRKSGVTLDRERARALNISMATTLIEPLPPGKVAYVELPNGTPVILQKSVTVLGRAAGVADVVVDDNGVSRQHAAIVYAQGDFFLEDLGSSNGTFAGGERVNLAQLTPGAEFSLGPNACRFMVRVR